ncbi:IclR family transcriptional regulator [Bosea sp. (in: a-proteobacteria)]|uniref:IclR family transcriptional regulator n=1 Tax=Bosea sp. (in: a-proteobacteria) TaxID=1871050 RepID=UPI002613DAFD|nr:IclR family transcriptional regulator [Bosea sp. (in: a-proteobacteria)]MCO5091656.1 IclR family transcriptional regulator [Bosea sp. (in: a-proteobacteria)]
MKKARAEADASGDDDPLFVRSLAKAFHILEAFKQPGGNLGLAQLCEITGYDKSTVQRFVHTLERIGYLERDPETRKCGISLKVLELSHAYLRTHQLVSKAFPYLVHLRQKTDETVNLCVLDGADTVYVSRIVGSHILNTDIMVGSRLPSYRTAPGLSIMSQMPQPEVLAILESVRLDENYTVPGIMKRIDRVGKESYALTVEEIFPNDMSVACPIVSHNRAIGAVSIGCSTLRRKPEDVVNDFVPLLRGVAHSLSNL